ncbi:MAG: NapC/NirT family cytochrome c [Acidobacteria bacterium]|nr:NapC/NirT family cytochrome c [Acidobacteriota bacterium]
MIEIPARIGEKARAGQRWLSPLVHLSNNLLSFIGVLLTTTGGVSWLFVLPLQWKGTEVNPYIGILSFLTLPAMFFLGLILVPLGIYFRLRSERRRGVYPETFPPLRWSNSGFRRLVTFIGVATGANVVIGGHFTYSAVNYMDTVSFCGQTCHTVMRPEFAAYQNSPHSRVECVKCHIGPGASWFVRSKLSGVGQVFAVTFNTYDRPIPTPIRDLRPARETCETCHWPQKYGGDRLRILTRFADDEANSATRTVLLMHVGGGNLPGVKDSGIHGVHLGPGVVIEYAHSDSSRQTIPWVRYSDATGRATVYLASGADSQAADRMPRRVMDCMDCHNRPTHAFETPEGAVDGALGVREISPTLPFAKKQSVELVKKAYASRQEAVAIPAAFETYYKDNYPDLYRQRQAEVARSARTVFAIFDRNVFPEMKVNWGTYPNNIGHTDFPGCFRCHDDQHSSADGKKITQDCNSCHNLVAVEEAAPKILTDLGILSPESPPQH